MVRLLHRNAPKAYSSPSAMGLEMVRVAAEAAAAEPPLMETISAFIRTLVTPRRALVRLAAMRSRPGHSFRSLRTSPLPSRAARVAAAPLTGPARRPPVLRAGFRGGDHPDHGHRQADRPAQRRQARGTPLNCVTCLSLSFSAGCGRATRRDADSFGGLCCPRRPHARRPWRVAAPRPSAPRRRRSPA